MKKLLVLLTMMSVFNGNAMPMNTSENEFKPWVSPAGDEAQQKEAYLSLATCLVKDFYNKTLGKYGIQFLGCPANSDEAGDDSKSFVAKMSAHQFLLPCDWKSIEKAEVEGFDPEKYVVKAHFAGHFCVRLSDGYWYQMLGSSQYGHTNVIRSSDPMPNPVVDNYGSITSFWVRARDKSANTNISAMEMDWLYGKKNGCDGISFKALLVRFRRAGIAKDCLDKLCEVEDEETLIALYELLMDKQRRFLDEELDGQIKCCAIS